MVKLKSLSLLASQRALVGWTDPTATVSTCIALIAHRRPRSISAIASTMRAQRAARAHRASFEIGTSVIFSAPQKIDGAQAAAPPMAANGDELHELICGTSATSVACAAAAPHVAPTKSTATQETEDTQYPLAEPESIPHTIIQQQRHRPVSAPHTSPYSPQYRPPSPLAKFSSLESLNSSSAPLQDGGAGPANTIPGADWSTPAWSAPTTPFLLLGARRGPRFDAPIETCQDRLERTLAVYSLRPKLRPRAPSPPVAPVVPVVPIAPGTSPPLEALLRPSRLRHPLSQRHYLLRRDGVRTDGLCASRSTMASRANLKARQSNLRERASARPSPAKASRLTRKCFQEGAPRAELQEEFWRAVDRSIAHSTAQTAALSIGVPDE